MKLGLISTSLVSVHGYETRTYMVLMSRKLGHNFRSTSFTSVCGYEIGLSINHVSVHGQETWTYKHQPCECSLLCKRT